MDPRAEKHNDIAELYDRMRPGYSKEMFKELRQAAHLISTSRLLEIGAGTGQATQELVKISSHVTALEPGPELMSIAKKKVTRANFVQSTFENFTSDEPFDCIFSASAWHWVDFTVGYKHARELLSDHGYLAIASHYFVEPDPSAFLNRAQPIFARFNTLIGLATADQIVAEKLNIESREFHVVADYQLAWQQTYSTDEYIALRNTFAAHQWMNERSRKGLERELRQLCESEYNGQVTISYRTALFVAAKK